MARSDIKVKQWDGFRKLNLTDLSTRENEQSLSH